MMAGQQHHHIPDAAAVVAPAPETRQRPACRRRQQLQQHQQRLLLALALAAMAAVAPPLLPRAAAQLPNFQAVDPSLAVQPLYACKMEVRDLPEFAGFPTPEMQDANVGISGATLNMLVQWRINETEEARPLPQSAAGAVVSFESGQQQQQQQQAFGSGGSVGAAVPSKSGVVGGGGGGGNPAAFARQALAPAPASPPPTYITPRPAAAAPTTTPAPSRSSGGGNAVPTSGGGGSGGGGVPGDRSFWLTPNTGTVSGASRSSSSSSSSSSGGGSGGGGIIPRQQQQQQQLLQPRPFGLSGPTASGAAPAGGPWLLGDRPVSAASVATGAAQPAAVPPVAQQEQQQERPSLATQAAAAEAPAAATALYEDHRRQQQQERWLGGVRQPSEALAAARADAVAAAAAAAAAAGVRQWSNSTGGFSVAAAADSSSSTSVGAWPPPPRAAEVTVPPLTVRHPWRAPMALPVQQQQQPVQPQQQQQQRQLVQQQQQRPQGPLPLYLLDEADWPQEAEAAAAAAASPHGGGDGNSDDDDAAAAAPTAVVDDGDAEDDADDDDEDDDGNEGGDAAFGGLPPSSSSPLPPNTTPWRRRRLFQAIPQQQQQPKQQQQQQGRSVCNKGTPTVSTGGPVGNPVFGQPQGTLGLTMASTGAVPPDATIAVGPSHAVHVVNSLVKILPVSSSGTILNSGGGSGRPGGGSGATRTIPLPDWFGLVASPCDGGYINPSATYDKLVGRFLVAATCAGDANQLLLSVSANSSALGTWILYSFPGEVTQGDRMACNDTYPYISQSQVGYNMDGVYLSFMQNCPSNQETATGAILMALPKWAVYKGATFFYAAVWTAWDVYDAVGIRNTDQLYPGAFLQLQPVLPQRAADVQAEVTYFVSDNLNFVNPLRRNQFTVAALINTGSLWLYEGPKANSPTPLLVARVVARGMDCTAVPTTKLVQPTQGDPGAGIGTCQLLDAGAMRPPGVWNGGAALYANRLYIADRGPDFQVPSTGTWLPTIYWAELTPSFCVSGPCAPFFGSDWGWSEGWDWRTGRWADKSDRGRNGYADPAFYNQVFLFPSSGSNARANAGGGLHGRRLRLLHEAADAVARAALAAENISLADGSGIVPPPFGGGVPPAGEQQQQQQQQGGSGGPSLLARDAVGAPLVVAPRNDSSSSAADVVDAAAATEAAATAALWDSSGGSLTAAMLRAQLGPKATRADIEAAVRASLERMAALRPSAEARMPTTAAAPPPPPPGAAGPPLAPGAAEAAGSGNGRPAPAELPPPLQQQQQQQQQQRIVRVAAAPVSVAAGAAQPVDLTEAARTAPVAGAPAPSGSPPPPASGGGGAGSARNTSAAFLGGGFGGFNGWGASDNAYYYNYYQYWREYYFLRNLYMNVRIPPQTNPCKYYKDWEADNDITFGALVSRKGVIEFVTQGDNPVGVAFPAVAVRGGSMLIVYSYSGPDNLPMSQGGIPAYPGVGYSVVAGNAQNTGAAFNLAQPGAGCVEQGGSPRWGSYSGADVHFPSYRVWTAVEYAYAPFDGSGALSNAGTWLSVFS